MHPGKDFVYPGESRLSSAQIDGESGCGSGLNVTCAITADRIPINDNITIEVSSPLICAARASTMAETERKIMIVGIIPTSLIFLRIHVRSLLVSEPREITSARVMTTAEMIPALSEVLRTA